MTSRNHFFCQGAISQEEIDFLSLLFEIKAPHPYLNNDRNIVVKNVTAKPDPVFGIHSENINFI
jgi:hypothetical protein